jgi:TRAP transporter TAXI family solute receptor
MADVSRPVAVLQPARSWICRVGWVSALALGAALTAAPAPAQEVNFAIATGGTGGVYYPLGSAIAKLLTRQVPGLVAIARVTGGSVDNLKMIGLRQSQVALAMVDAALDASRGKHKFSAGRIDLRTLMVLYPNRMHVVTLEGRGIVSMPDLRGKRVSIGGPGSATELMADRIVEALGLGADINRQRLGLTAAVEALKTGRIDAFFFAGGLPTAAIAELAAMPGLRIRLIDHAAAVTDMNMKYGDGRSGGVYASGVIPKDTYVGQGKDNTIAIVQNILVADATLPDQIAYRVVKAIAENRDELISVHDEARNIALDNQSPKNSPIPWHPGAVKYLNEKGARM